MARASLRVVQPGAKPPKTAAALTVKQAAGSSQRDLLIALRDRIAGDIDKGVPPHALAPLSRQLREIAREVELIDAATKGDVVANAADTPDETWVAN